MWPRTMPQNHQADRAVAFQHRRDSRCNSARGYSTLGRTRWPNGRNRDKRHAALGRHRRLYGDARMFIAERSASSARIPGAKDCSSDPGREAARRSVAKAAHVSDGSTGGLGESDQSAWVRQLTPAALEIPASAARKTAKLPARNVGDRGDNHCEKVPVGDYVFAGL